MKILWFFDFSSLNSLTVPNRILSTPKTLFQRVSFSKGNLFFEIKVSSRSKEIINLDCFLKLLPPYLTNKSLLISYLDTLLLQYHLIVQF